MDNQTMLYIWLGATVLFGIIEAATVGLTSVWFAVGALAAIIAAAFDAAIWVQLLLFVVVTALMLLITRPLVKKYITPKITRTNADGMIGQTAVVLERIDNDEECGSVKVAGKIWTARSEALPIEVDTKVTILRIEGVKLIVRAI